MNFSQVTARCYTRNKSETKKFVIAQPDGLQIHRAAGGWLFARIAR
jgi:hypothetical protein